METLKITDAFGREYDSETLADDGERVWPGLQPPANWSLFRTAELKPGEPGLSDEALALWHVAEFPLQSGPIERVQFGLDEESNLLWALERVIDGREAASRQVEQPDEALHPKFSTVKPPGASPLAREFVYLPGQGAATHWHPYMKLEEGPDERPRRLEQRRLVDFTREKPWPLPAPEAAVLQPDAGRRTPLGRAAVNSQQRHRGGAPLATGPRYGRPTGALDSTPASSAVDPPGRRLRFDVMVEDIEK